MNSSVLPLESERHESNATQRRCTQSAKENMKTINLLVPLGTVAAFLAVHPVLAQVQPTLGLQLYAGVSITGTVGTVYAIQASTNVADTNSWTTVSFVQFSTGDYLWTDTSTPATGRRFYRALATAPTSLVFIPPGTFRMGSPTNEVDREPGGSGPEGPQTAVTLTKGFYMGKYLVTQGEYLALMGTNPSTFPDTIRPVEQVSWNDATNYCAKRTQQETTASLIPAGSRYRLPTEAEWEYACRAWTSTRFYYGDDPGYTNLTSYAWYLDNSSGMTHPVGQKLPNSWGLYDMAGNVAEWCQDWYSEYPGGSVTDPNGPASPVPGFPPDRVVRGGTWGLGAAHCRSAWRVSKNPAESCDCLGFRVVLAEGQ
jgi:formylglycine-generating enzyme required for sulfatase activity